MKKTKTQQQIDLLKQYILEARESFQIHYNDNSLKLGIFEAQKSLQKLEEKVAKRK